MTIWANKGRLFGAARGITSCSSHLHGSKTEDPILLATEQQQTLIDWTVLHAANLQGCFNLPQHECSSVRKEQTASSLLDVLDYCVFSSADRVCRKKTSSEFVFSLRRGESSRKFEYGCTIKWHTKLCFGIQHFWRQKPSVEQERGGGKLDDRWVFGTHKSDRLMNNHVVTTAHRSVVCWCLLWLINTLQIKRKLQHLTQKLGDFLPRTK